jgi:hypothetical protein
MSLRTAPKSFVEKLKAISDELTAEWSDKHQRWFIAHGTSEGKPKYIYCAMEPDGCYRDLDERTISDLAVMFFKDRDVPDTWEHMEEENKKREQESMKLLDEEISDANDYCWDALKGNRHIAMPRTLKKTNGGLYVPDNAGN